MRCWRAWRKRALCGFRSSVLLLCDRLIAVSQSLANALLAIVADEKLAASIREDPPAFELLRGFQVPSCFLVTCVFEFPFSWSCYSIQTFRVGSVYTAEA